MGKLDGMRDILSCEKCYRCNGLLVSDKFVCQFQWIDGIRCVNCGWVKLKEVLYNVSKPKTGNTDKQSELELYRTRSRSVKRYRYSVQHQ